MKTSKKFIVLLLYTSFTFGQESGSFEIKINRDNQKFELYPGETFIIISMSGTVNKCPYVKKKKKGGVFGIGRKTVKIQVNNPHDPNNLPPSFTLGDKRASDKIRLPNQNIISYSLQQSELKTLISSKSTLKFKFSDEDGVVCSPGTGPSNGGYITAYKIDSSKRFDLLEDYLDASLNTKPITIEDIQNLDSQLFNRRLKKFNPNGLARLIFNHLQKNNNYTDIEKLDLYEKTVDHISSNYIPMLSELSKLASNYDRFNLSKKVANRVIAAMDDFNPKTYYTKNILAKAFHAKARSLFEENFGLFSDDLVGANAAYLNATLNYIDIGEKSKAIDCILKSSKALQKLKDEASLNRALENVINYRDSIIKPLENRGWYFTDPEKAKSFIVEENQIVKPLDNTDKFELKNRKLIGVFEEFIIFPGNTLTFLDTDDYDSIEIYSVRSAFGKGCQLITKANQLKGDNSKADAGDSFDDIPNTGKSKDGRPGVDGKAGRNGKNLKIYSGLVQLDGLIIDTSGGKGQGGGDGGNGSKSMPEPFANAGKGKGGQPGIGGIGGQPGIIDIKFMPIDVEFTSDKRTIFKNKVIETSRTGHIGERGLFGIEYAKWNVLESRKENIETNLSSDKLSLLKKRESLSDQPILNKNMNIKWIENEQEFSDLFSGLNFKYKVKRMKDNPREK